ncbi:MAG: DUF362 domain-containing protein [archaeon]
MVKEKIVSIVECADYNESKVFKAVEKAFTEIGGIKSYLNENQRVLLKPNYLMAKEIDKAITTHPTVLKAVVKLIRKNFKKVEIIIGESSGADNELETKKAFKINKLADLQKEFKVKLENFNNEKVRKIVNNENELFKSFYLAETVKNVDLIISLPKMKTHTLTIFTGAVKNFMGCLPGEGKKNMHITGFNTERFGTCVLDLYNEVSKTKCIALMDAVIGMEGNGPAHGTPKNAGIIIAGNDCLALDFVASKLVGFKVNEIPFLRQAKEKSLLNENEVKVIGKQDLNFDFKKPSGTTNRVPGFMIKFFFEQSKALPKANKEKCVKCMVCFNHCPVKAIDKNININYKKCIKCYCCHELCKYNAMELKPKMVYSVLKRIRKLMERNSK